MAQDGIGLGIFFEHNISGDAGGGSGRPAPKVIAIIVTPDTPSAPLGSSVQFKATAVYENGSTLPVTGLVQWSSSVGARATINSSGLAQTHALGATVIEARFAQDLGFISDTTTLTVTQAAIVSIEIIPAAHESPLGINVPVTVRATYSDGAVTDVTNDVTWATTNGAVATASGGTITTRGIGDATLRATIGSITSTTSFTTLPPILVSVEVTPSGPTLPKGTTKQLVAAGVYSDNSRVDLTFVSAWESSDPAHVLVNEQGVAHGVELGTSSISATYQGIAGTTTAETTPAILVSLEITPRDSSAPLGYARMLTAIGTYSDGTTRDLTSSVTWSSSSEAVLTVSGGVVTTVAEGYAVITASIVTSGTISTSTEFTVEPPALVSIGVTPDDTSLADGLQQAYTATGTYSDGSQRDLTLDVTWATGDSETATIAPDGTLTGQGEGQTLVGAMLGDIAGFTTITITPAVLVSIEFSPSSISIPKGADRWVNVIGTYSNGGQRDVTVQATLVSADESIAIVESNGSTHAVAMGSTTITATLGGFESVIPVSVTPAALVSITISPSTPSVPLGLTTQLVATGHYTDGTTQDLTNTVTWEATDPAIATVSSSGLLSSVSQGSTSVSVLLGAVVASVPVAITPPVIVSITVAPLNPSVPLGLHQQMTATANYSDGSQTDVTTQVTWESSNPDKAAIDTQGLVTTLEEGDTTITATLGAHDASTTLEVAPPVLVSIEIMPSDPSVPLGDSQQLTAIGTYSDGVTVDLTGAVTWISNEPSKVTVNASGEATAVSLGLVGVSATLDGVTGSATVTAAPARLVSIAVTPGDPSVPLGFSQQLTATGTYSDGTTRNITGEVIWTSADESHATVDGEGVLHTVAMGDAAITATVAGITGGTTVTVAPPVLVSLSFQPENPSAPVGTSMQLHVIGHYSDGSTADLTASTSFSSNNAAVATVNGTGLVTAVAEGGTGIQVSVGGVFGSVPFTSTPPVLVLIAIVPANPSVPLGLSTTLSAVGTYSDGSTRDVTAGVTWGATGGVTVSTDGILTGYAQGQGTVSATLGGVTGTAPVSITPPVVVSIDVRPDDASTPVGIDTTQLYAYGTFSDGSMSDISAQVTWGTTTPALISVSSAGVVTGNAQGTGFATATFEGVTGTGAVSVTPPIIVSIAVTPSNSSVPKGLSEFLAATATYSDGSTRDVTQTATWSSGSLHAEVSEGGYVQARSQGTATISATQGGAVGYATVTVTNPVLMSISVPTASVPKGLTQQLSAIGTYSDNSTLDVTSQVTWTALTPSKATVSATGVATGVSQGAANVSAAIGNISGTGIVNVGAPVLMSVAVTPPNPSIPKGTQTVLTATGTYSDGSTANVTSQATWSSSDASKATVSGGFVTGVNLGGTTISASVGGIVGQTNVTVSAPIIVSIAVTPANPSIPNGLSRQLTATATYSDGTTGDVTNTATWTSGTPSKATVNSTGLVTGVSQGQAQITAAVGSVSGSTTVTIAAPVLVSINVTPQNPYVVILAVLQLTATGVYSDGTTANLTSQVTWSSNNLSVGVALGGLVTAITVGSATITATLGAISGSTTVNSVVSTILVGDFTALALGIATLPAGFGLSRGTASPLATVQTGPTSVQSSGIGANDARIGKTTTLGPNALVLEHASTNTLLNSRDPLSSTGWVAATGSATDTHPSLVFGPDGASGTATRHVITTTGVSRSAPQTLNATCIASMWGTRGDVLSSAASWRPGTSNSSWPQTSTIVWQRLQQIFAGAASWGFAPAAGNAQNTITDLHQVEAGSIATEAIITGGTTGARAGERLFTGLSVVDPNNGRITQYVYLQPKGSSTQYGSNAMLWYRNANNHARFNAATRTVTVVVGGVSYTTPVAMTWALGDSVEIVCAAGGSIATKVAYRVNAASAITLSTGSPTVFGALAAGSVDVLCASDLGTVTPTNQFTAWVRNVNFTYSGYEPF